MYNAFVHMGEEPSLVPCFTVFLTGCNFRCVHCSDGEQVERPGLGVPLDPSALAARVAATEGLRSVEFVGGLPDVNLLAVARCAELLPPHLPVVLNTNAYFTLEALDSMSGWVDILVADLKHGPGDCAARIAGVDRYWGIVTRNLLAAAPRHRLLVRHLILPGHLQCCTRPALEWLAAHLPEVEVNLMTGYRPLHRVAGIPGRLGRRLGADATREVLGWEVTGRLTRLSVDGAPTSPLRRRAAAPGPSGTP